jgi:hypothetical protein
VSTGVEQFVEQARAYCAFVRGAHRLAPAARLHEARRRLLELYTASLVLTHVEDDFEDAPRLDIEPPPEWPGFGIAEDYFEVANPYAPDDEVDANVVASTLSGDVLDVYRDVGRGLAMWDGGHQLAALFDWHLMRDSHWGNHAVDALRVLHRVCRYSTGHDIYTS